MIPGRLPSVAVVIPAYNAERTVGTAVRAALAQDHPAVRVVVVDDGSTDGTPGILGEIDGITVIRQGNRGPAAARNTGWRSVPDADVVFFLDADCIPPPDWVSRLLPYHADAGTGCVGGVYGIANPHSMLARIVYREFERRYEFCGPHPSFIGSYGYSFRRAVLEQHGGFDETYRRASHEDNDLCWRLVRASLRLRLVPEVVVRHHFPESLRSYLVTQARHGYWRMKILRAYPGSALGDEYSNPFDYLQPPLVLAAAVALLLDLFGKGPGVLEPAMFAGAALLFQAPVATGFRRLGGRRRELAAYCCIVGPSRAFARALGMVAGGIRFWGMGRAR